MIGTSIAGPGPTPDRIGATTFRVQVANNPPILNSDIVGTSKIIGQELVYTFGGSAFTDPDGDSLNYYATLFSGDPLPEWLRFINTNRTFVGIPEEDPTTSSYIIKVFAEDGYGGQASDTFTLTVTNNNPVVAVPLPD